MKIKTSIYLIAATCMLLASCSQDVLDKQPTDQMSNSTYWTSSDNALMAVNACYRYFGDDWWKTFLTSDTDDSYTWTDWPCPMRPVANGSATSDNGVFDHFWSFYYQAIARANNVTDNIGKVPNMDESLRKRYAAEARFIRDYAYQQLIGLYGDVRLITTFPQTSEFQGERTSKQKVVDFLVKDIEDFANDLPVSYDKSNFGRVTRDAAYSLEARILLYNGNYAEAAAAAYKVIQPKRHTIDDNFVSLFDGTNKQSSEIILSAQYIPNTYTSGLATWLGGPSLSGWSEVVPTQSLADAFDCTDGKSITDSPLYDASNPYKNRDPRMGFTIILPGTVVNGKTIDATNPNTIDAVGKNNASPTGYYYRKCIPAVISGNYDGNSYNDIIILRYAEVLLTYAEGKIEANDIDESVYDAINQVRQRADVNLPAIPTGKSQPELREIVRHERRVEFAGEEQRLFDIRRWKIVEKVMPGSVYGMINTWDKNSTGYGKNLLIESRTFNSNRDYLWAIPTSETGVNKKITQNPGW